MSRIYFLVIASSLMIASLSGCNPHADIVPVSGRVLINGKPLLKEGFVRVEPVGERPSSGRINPEDGTFTLSCYETDDGCQLGTHPVAVGVSVVRNDQNISLIDEKYRLSQTSGLTVTIEGPTKDLTIELTGNFKNIVGNQSSLE